MTLTTALNSAIAGISSAEAQISVVSSNVTNADKDGYTKKTYEQTYSTTSSGTVPVSGTVVTAVYDEYLYESLVEDAADVSYYETIADYLDTYSDKMGTVDDDSTLSSSLDDLMTALDSLYVSPDDGSLKTEVVTAAEILASEIRSLSSTVQDLRDQADTEIADTVTSINTLLETIDSYNDQIAQAESAGLSTADLEDERRVALQELAGYLDIDYYYDDNNQLKIYTNGYALLDSSVHELSFTEANIVNSETTYPGGLSGITLNGIDITSSIDSGTLAALIELRDETLVEEQEKLDEMATTLMETVNTILNEGASLPAREDIVGDTDGLDATDTFSATGEVVISAVDTDGVVVATATIDLSTCTTIQDVLDAINSAFGGDVTASLTSNGSLELVSNVDDVGIALNQSTSSVGTDSVSFSYYFGLNNLFTGTGANDISVSDYLEDSAEYLATGTLDTTAAVGDAGVNPGDGDIAEALADCFTESVSFDAAGGFAAQNTSLSTYATRIMSSIATAASTAETQYDSVSTLYESTQTALDNLTGVNVDEEMADLVELQAMYEASATVITTVRDLFQDLLDAVG